MPKDSNKSKTEKELELEDVDDDHSVDEEPASSLEGGEGPLEIVGGASEEGSLPTFMRSTKKFGRLQDALEAEWASEINREKRTEEEVVEEEEEQNQEGQEQDQEEEEVTG